MDAYEWSSEHGDFLRAFVRRLLSGGWGSARCSVLWKTLDVDPASRRVLHLASSAPDEEAECMLATPAAQESGNKPELFSEDNNRKRHGEHSFGMGLTQQLAMIPTPGAGDYKSPNSKIMDSVERHKKNGVKKQIGLRDVIPMSFPDMPGIPSESDSRNRTRTEKYSKGRVPTPPEAMQKLNAMLPTPKVSIGQNYEDTVPRNTPSLQTILSMLPTPSALVGQNYMDTTPRNTPSLQTIVSMIPTPTTRDYKGARKPEMLTSGRKENNSLEDKLVGTNRGLKLQPRFVEWMMGFPEGWTEVPKTVKDKK